ncbi:MAG: sigma 54-interacting transcriptional regulator [Byssovorax sp.]
MVNPSTPGGTRTAPLPTNEGERMAPTRAPRRQVVLLVHHRDGVEVVSLVPGAAVVVGREAPADVVVADRCLSRSHARFTLIAAEAVAVEDLGSTNGTRIGGERVERASIKPGDQVMLGTIAVAVHVFTGDDATPRGLEGHDAFVAGVDAEIARARFFRRPLAVLMIRAMDGDLASFPRWCVRVRQLLRPVDRIGLYGAAMIEVLLPEATPEEALALGRSLVAAADDEPFLGCGIASFPGSGASAEALLSAALEVVVSASASDPLRAAASAALRTVEPEARSSSRDDDELLVASPAMRALAETAARVARSSIPVLLQGETGSGKELVARRIHAEGPRRGRPLVCVNCGAIPAQLVESTLFGHERGAFTGALQQHKGVFEAADGGTVLLDEVGELPAAAQAALLRVLETKRITRVGSTREIEVDVRVIAATHRDLEAMSEAGAFRLDLYYRLGAIILAVPPLRERREEIARLAQRFLARAEKAAGRGSMRLDPDALALLDRYAWPGNVRELRNAIERAVVIADGDTLTPRDLPARIGARAAKPTTAAAPADPAHTGSLKERMERFERDTLVAALRETAGNQTEAAALLSLPLRTLQHKLKGYGIKKTYAAGDEA